MYLVPLLNYDLFYIQLDHKLRRDCLLYAIILNKAPSSSAYSSSVSATKMSFIFINTQCLIQYFNDMCCFNKFDFFSPNIFPLA